MLDGLKISIIGAGIGGLAAARLLALKGANVRVIEQASEISEVGAGLQISPNGLAVLRGIGLEDKLLNSGAVVASMVSLSDYRGQPVVRLDLTQLAPQRYLFAHRADLISVLKEGAVNAGVTIELNQKVTGVRDGLEAAVYSVGDQWQTADLVVGADGVHSVVRSQLNGASDPFFTGHVAWRAIVPNRWRRESDVQVHMGPRRHLVSYPLRGGTQINIVAVEERKSWSKESWTQNGNAVDLRRVFDDFGDEATSMLAEVKSVKQWGLFRHEVAQKWHGKRLVLLGDAVHPTLPFLAQGAVMALEDAWVLARSLNKAASVEQGLATYQSRREARVRRVVNAATGNAWKYHLSFPPLRFAAHTALRFGGRIAPGVMLKQFNWLYGHDVTQA